MYEKLDKKIASTRIFSRRQTNYLIKNNKVKVNNVIVNSPTTLVNTQDIIKVNDKIIHIFNETPKLYLFNKPRGFLTTKNDPLNRSTIYDILPKELQRFLYIGRLDLNTEGLLLLTNNGVLANYMTSAKNNIIRIYKVKTFGKITQQQLNKLKSGIIINNIIYRKIEAKIIKQNNLQTWISFSLTEGKNNEIRKICSYFNLKVSRLIRTNFGPFTLNNLPKGNIKLISSSAFKRHYSFLYKTIKKYKNSLLNFLLILLLLSWLNN